MNGGKEERKKGKKKARKETQTSGARMVNL